MGGVDIQWVIAGAAVAVALLAAIGTAVVARRSRQMRIARDQILAYLRGNDFTMISLERIKELINPKYDDDFLLSLPDYFPSHLRKARLRDKDGKLTRLGLARVRPDEAIAEGTAGESSAG